VDITRTYKDEGCVYVYMCRGEMIERLASHQTGKPRQVSMMGRAAA